MPQTSGTPMTPIRRGTAIAYLLAGLAALEFVWETWQVQPQIDDAYISFRYARNLVEGLGLVYNAGEYVEGITNLLWSLLVAAGLVLGLEAETTAHWLGVLGGVATLVLTCTYAQSGLRADRRWLAGLAPWILLGFPSLVRWSESGLETCLFLGGVVGTLAAAARGRMGWAVASAIVASLLRPDGALLAGIVFGLPLLATRFREWHHWRAPLVYGAAMLCLTAFRLYYYGYPVSNTFYAKVGGIPLSYGFSALWTFSRDGVWLLALTALPAAFTTATFRTGAVYSACVVVYVVSIGGDVLGTDRLFLPALPAVVAMAVVSLAWAYDRSRRLGVLFTGAVAAATALQLWGSIPLEIALPGGALLTAWLLAGELAQPRLLPATAGIAGLGLVVYFVAPFGDGSAQKRFVDDYLRSSARSRTIARVRETRAALERVALYQLELLQQQSPNVGLVALTGIGHFGYHSRLPVLGLVGLIDETIARTELPPREGAIPVPGHQRSNADYVLGRKPDYILIGKKGPKTGLRAHLDIWDHPSLERDYVWDPVVMGYRRRGVEVREVTAVPAPAR